MTSTSGNQCWPFPGKGHFAGVADPANCKPLTSRGPIDGSYTLTLTSSTGPDPAGLAPQYVGEVSTMKRVQDLFDGHATNIVGDYAYSYQHGKYVQTTQSITGDVTGH